MDRWTDGVGIHAVEPAAADPQTAEALAGISGRVVRWYALVATAWIVASDLGVASVRGEAIASRLPDMVKGLAFVVVTTLVLWLVLRRLTGTFDRVFVSTVTAQRDFYGAVLDTSSDVVAIFDAGGRCAYVNDAITDVLGWLPKEVLGRQGREFVHPIDQPAAIGFGQQVTAAGDPTDGQRTFMLRHRDGSFRTVEVSGSAIRLRKDEQGLVVNARDVTDRRRSERQLRAALAQDVTGLPSLRMFLAEMDGLDELRPDGLTATVAMLDIDRFGSINELHGRDAGDVVLRELAQRLDAALPEALGIWRHGADEFVFVVLDDEDDPDGGTEPRALAERVHAEVAQPVVLDGQGHRVAVQISLGVVVVPLTAAIRGEALSATLLRATERALDEAKGHPDRIAVHLQISSSHGGDQARLVAELHDAIEHDQLVAHYQPKVRLDDLRVVGVEALVRWQHPDRGLLSPADFLPAVAAGNLWSAVTRTVLHDALVSAAAWLRSPGCDPDFAVCVNISLDDLRRRRFAADVFAALDETGLDPHRLCLELTEQTMLADPRGASAVVAELRRAGIQIAIDDFGTGYSTLEHIRVFEVDEIKIDKGFVQRLGTSSADEAIVDSVLAITRRIGVRVVAEGIEEQVALDYLRERGCELGQGYLFSKPVPAEEFDPAARYRVSTT